MANLVVLGPAIPGRAKVFGWILVLAGTFFAFVYMLSPGTFFPGVVNTSYSAHFGLYSTSVRILAAVLGIIIALVLNSAALLALMLVLRIFTELGDVVLGLVINHGSPDANTLLLTVLALIEAYFLMTLLRLVVRPQGHA